MRTLWDVLHAEGFLEEPPSHLVEAWLDGLRENEPTRVASFWRGVRKISEVPALLGNAGALLRHEGLSARSRLERAFVDPARAYCNKTGDAVMASVAQWSQPLISDIVLVVVFNNLDFFWRNLPVLETVHRPFFK